MGLKERKPTPKSSGGTAASTMANSKKTKATTSAIVLTDDYRPSENEPFMNERHRLYFRRKLMAWKEDIIRQTRETVQGLNDDNGQHADIRTARRRKLIVRWNSGRVTASGSSFRRSTQPSPGSKTGPTVIAKRRASRSVCDDSRLAPLRPSASRRRSATSAVNACSGLIE